MRKNFVGTPWLTLHPKNYKENSLRTHISPFCSTGTLEQRQLPKRQRIFAVQMSLTKSNFRSGNIFAWLGLSLMHYWDHWWFEGWWVGGWTISGGGGIQPEGLPRVCCFGPRQLLQGWWVGQLFIPIKPKVTYRTFCKKKRHFDKEVAVSYFLVILVRKSSTGWWLHITRCVDYKQCSAGPNWPNQVPILANLTCQYKFWAGKPKKHFLGHIKGRFLGFHELWKFATTHWSSKYMYLIAKYTKYTMATTKFSIWRHEICEICKKKLP